MFAARSSSVPSARSLGLPARHPDASLPPAVTVYEVGPRDGLQAEAAAVPTAEKVEFVRALHRAGLPVVEATSFVDPRWIPQLADAAEVMSGLGDLAAACPVLVPNLRGLERALDAGARHIAVFVSATQTFARRNLNRDREQAIAAALDVVSAAREQGVKVRGYVSMAFGDPWEGAVDPVEVAKISTRLWEAGASEVSVGDTIGVATPGHVTDVVTAHAAAGVPVQAIAMHFHDTYGQALANVLAALHAGVTTFDSSAGGLGGCPYAGSATGNLATEDLLWMLEGLGIRTGVDLEAVLVAARRMTETVGKAPSSRVLAATA